MGFLLGPSVLGRLLPGGPGVDISGVLRRDFCFRIKAIMWDSLEAHVRQKQSLPKGSKYHYSTYMGPKVVIWKPLEGQSMYHMPVDPWGSASSSTPEKTRTWDIRTIAWILPGP